VKLAIFGRMLRVDTGHLLFLIAIGSWCVWYLFDARAASTNLQNLLLIQPAVIVGLALILFALRSTIHVDADAGPAPESTEEGRDAVHERQEVIRVFGFMALLGIYLVLIPRLGLDVATPLFIAACLLGQGERRLHVLVGIPLIFTVLVVYGFKALLPIPIPTLLG